MSSRLESWNLQKCEAGHFPFEWSSRTAIRRHDWVVYLGWRGLVNRPKLLSTVARAPPYESVSGRPQVCGLASRLAVLTCRQVRGRMVRCVLAGQVGLREAPATVDSIARTNPQYWERDPLIVLGRQTVGLPLATFPPGEGSVPLLRTPKSQPVHPSRGSEPFIILRNGPSPGGRPGTREPDSDSHDVGSDLIITS